MNCWYVLGISPTKNAEEIKEAYKRELKKHHPEDDPAGFKALRNAYSEAMEYAAREDGPKESENVFDDTPSGRFLKELNDIYYDYKRRIDPEEWKKLLSGDALFCLDTHEETEEGIMTFLMSHHFIPGVVWGVITDSLEVGNRRKELKEKYPDNFLDYMLNNSRYPDSFDYAALEFKNQAFKPTDIDEYIDGLYRVRAVLGERKFDEAEGVIKVLEAMPFYHPFVDIQRIHMYIWDGQTEKADAISKRICEKYSNDDDCLMARAMFLFSSKQYAKGREMYEKLTGSKVVGYAARCGLADCLLEEGRYEEAAAAYKKLLMEKHFDGYVHYRLSVCNEALINELSEKIKNDDDPELAVKLCWAYYQNNRTDEAYDVIKNAKENGPVLMDILYLQGRCLLMKRMFAQAQARFARWLQIFDTYRSLEGEVGDRNREREELVYYFLGEVEREEKNYITALEYNEKAIRCMKIDKDLIMCQKGMVLKKLKRYDEAFEAFEAALEYSFDNVNAMLCLGDLSRLKGNVREAEWYYERASFALDGLPEARGRLCRLYLDEGLPEQAEEILEAFKKENYESAAMDFCEALIYAGKRDYKKAAEIIKKLNAMDYYSPECDIAGIMEKEEYDYEAVNILVEAGEMHPAEAADIMRKVVKSEPDNVNYAYYLAGLCFRNSQDADAIKYYKKALKLSPGNETIMMAIANFYRESGDPKEKDTLLGLLKIDPDHPDANGHIGDFYDRRRDYKHALEYYGRQLIINPNDYYYTSRGIVYMELEESDKAFADFDSAAQEDPGNPYPYYNTGRLYMRLKKAEEAEDYLRKALLIAGDEKRKVFYNLLSKCIVRLRDKKNVKKELDELFDKMAGVFPDDPDVYIKKAECLGAAGLMDDALDCYMEAKKLDKEGNYCIDRDIALLLLDETFDPVRTSEFINSRKEYLENGEFNTVMYYFHKYFENDEEEYKAIRKIDPHDAMQNYDTAVAIRKIAQKKRSAITRKKLLEEAEELLNKSEEQSKKMIRFASDKMQGLKRLALICIERGEQKEAKKLLDEMEKAPLCDYCYCTECYELYMTRAKYYMELGDKEAALSNIGRAYELCKNDGEILLIMKKIKEM